MAVETFRKYIEENKIDIVIINSDESTHTAVEAATVNGVPVSNIVKSLLVKIDNDFILFLVPGDRRLDLESLRKRFNTENIRMANAEEVKENTGYSIGGVPPFGHIKKLKTYIEDGFDINKEVVAAAGSSNSVFKCYLDELEKIISL